MQEQADNLDVIDPAGREVTIGGRTVEVKPLPLGKLPAFARTVRKLGDALGKLVDFENLSPMDILDLIADHGETLFDAAALASEFTRKEIENADPVAFVELLGAIIKVNADFFGPRLIDMMRVVMVVRAAKAEAATPGDGKTP